MAYGFALPLRIVQGFIALLVLILMAYVVSNWSYYWSPDSANFLLFVACWTLLAVAYLLLVSVRFAEHPVGHKFGVLAVEIVTMIFWFAGWVAVAALLGDIPYSQVCSSKDENIMLANSLSRVGPLNELQKLLLCLPQSNGTCLTSWKLSNDTNWVCRLLFVATMIFSSLHCWRTRGDRRSKQDPNMAVDNRV